MVNLEANNINIMINIVLVMILVDIGQYWFQILIMILIVILIMILVNIDHGDPVEFLWRSCGVPVEFGILWRSCGVLFGIDIGLDIDHDIGRY